MVSNVLVFGRLYLTYLKGEHGMDEVMSYFFKTLDTHDQKLKKANKLSRKQQRTILAQSMTLAFLLGATLRISSEMAAKKKEIDELSHEIEELKANEGE